MLFLAKIIWYTNDQLNIPKLDKLPELLEYI